MSVVSEPEEVTFSLRPGGGGFNPFAQLGKGAGLTLPSLSLQAGSPHAKTETRGKRDIQFKYSTKFLLKFKEHYSHLPAQLANVMSDIFVSESEKNNQNDNNWRKDNQPGENQGELPKIQTAADIGASAWAPTKTTGMDLTLKQIRGLLNKLTPEKYESLLLKFIEQIDSVESLSKAIPLIFEKAVAEPTFVALYAQLCQDLSQKLPEFKAADESGDQKPVKFQKLLLNTCQDEYEGIDERRKKLAELTEEQEIRVATTKLKQHLLGTMRLISEMFNKKLVTEVIMKVCMKDLLDGAYLKGVVSEENVEALCEVITLAGKAMDDSKLKKQLAAWLNNMDKMTTYDEMAPRLKFLIKDVLELRKSGWKARKQKFTAKKINEIREAAQAELGITDMQFNDTYLQPLPGQGQPDVELFPGFKEAAAAAAMPQRPAPVQQPTPPKTPVKEPAKKAEPEEELTEEDRENKTESLLSEYLGVADKEEALHCINEIKEASFMARLVELVVKKLLDSIQSREHDLIMDLMMELVASSVVTPQQFTEGLRRHTDQLADLSLDVPKAPQLVSKALALVLSTKKISLNMLKECCVVMEDTETQRSFTALVLQELISVMGKDVVTQQLAKDGVKGEEFLAADAEFDPPDMESVADFLKSQGLDGVLTP